jgi:hypothetical protein
MILGRNWGRNSGHQEFCSWPAEHFGGLTTRAKCAGRWKSAKNGLGSDRDEVLRTSMIDYNGRFDLDGTAAPDLVNHLLVAL